MKKLLALLTLAALLMTAFVCPTLAESPMTGGWSTYTEYANEDYAIAIAKDNTELMEKVNAALEELVGCVYKPIALLATQVVAGTNYCFLCETTVVAPDAQPSYALVYVFDGLSGEHEILRVQEIEFSAFE